MSENRIEMGKQGKLAVETVYGRGKEAFYLPLFVAGVSNLEGSDVNIPWNWEISNLWSECNAQ